jgi:hypothetical protein
MSVAPSLGPADADAKNRRTAQPTLGGPHLAPQDFSGVVLAFDSTLAKPCYWPAAIVRSAGFLSKYYEYIVDINTLVVIEKGPQESFRSLVEAVRGLKSGLF